MDQIEASIHRIIGELVERLPAVTGALVSSADGFALASRIPDGDGVDISSVAAMSAAAVGLANSLVGLTGDAAVDSCHHRSVDGQVFVFRIAHIAVLTVLTDANADAERIRLVGREVAHGLQRLFRSTANV